MLASLRLRACQMENREPEPEPEQPLTPSMEVKLASLSVGAEPQREPADAALEGLDRSPDQLSSGVDSSEWRTRIGLLLTEVRNWFARNTHLPQWLPPSWRHPLIAYIAAAVVEVLATLVTSPIVLLFPNFGFRGVVPLVGVVFFALQFGAAPGLIATVVSTIVLYAAILEPTVHTIQDEEAHILGILIYLIVNLA